MSGFDNANAGRSIAHFLGLSMSEVGPVEPGTAHLQGTAPASLSVRSADGGIAMGALLTLADSIGGLGGGLAALPGWVVSTNLMLRAVNRQAVGPLGLESHVLRAGKRSTITEIRMIDTGSENTLVATGMLTSAVLEPVGGPPAYDRPLIVRAPDLDPSSELHLTEFLGAVPTAANQLLLPITDDLRNPWGILHGGVTAALVDLAGCHATGAAATTDAVLHYLSPGRVGPVTATATSHGERTDGTIVRVEIRDQGAHDRLMAVAITTVQ